MDTPGEACITAALSAARQNVPGGYLEKQHQSDHRKWEIHCGRRHVRYMYAFKTITRVCKTVDAKVALL